MATEKTLLNDILLKFGGSIGTYFRNNTGVGWVGKLLSKHQKTDGCCVVIDSARPLHAGLTNGSSDLIGWTRVEITADMVGRNVAVFTAFECKTDRGKPTKEQINFVEQIQKSGGIAGVVKSVEDAYELIRAYK